MDNKFYFKALDKSLKDIMSETPRAYKKLYGGKVVFSLDKFYRLFQEVVYQILFMQQSIFLIFGISAESSGLYKTRAFKMVQLLQTKRKSSFFRVDIAYWRLYYV